MATKRKPVDRVDQIVTFIDDAKARAIKRIVKQLQRMAPQDVRSFERLIGRR